MIGLKFFEEVVMKDFFLYILMCSGVPLMVILFKIKGFDEIVLELDPFIMLRFCGLISWIFVILSGVWIWNHVTISL